MNEYKINAYTIAETLVTLLVIALIFIALAPSIVGKKPKLKQFFKAQHGIYTCTRPRCEFELPTEVKDAFIITVGGGGGGAASNCGSDRDFRMNSTNKDVDYPFSLTPKIAHYLTALAAGGASWQGQCDVYPLEFKQSVHDKRCNIYENVTAKVTTYGEKEDKKLTCNAFDKDSRGNCIMGAPSTGWSSYSPARYEHVKVSEETINVGKCNLNNKEREDCYSKSESDWFPHLGRQTSKSYTVVLGKSQEAVLTGKDYVCDTEWLLKPDKNMPNRYCNKKVFGGKGGDGQGISNKRLCPMPSPDAPCIRGRAAHSVPVGCRPEDIVKGYKWEGEDGDQSKMCGHPAGAYGCYEPHNRENLPAICYEYAKTDKTMTIGRPGIINGQAANPIIIQDLYTLSGGNGGQDSIDGGTGAGKKGGGHGGMSGAYSQFDFDNTMNFRRGENGEVTIVTPYINVGGGGMAGEFKAGYYRNIKGTIIMEAGAKGIGGKDGGVGTDGGDSSVSADEGIFTSNKVLLKSKGGLAGKQSKHYEVCENDTDDPALGDNNHAAPAGQASKEALYGGGGQGAGGRVPGCEAANGGDGKQGAVILFY